MMVGIQMLPRFLRNYQLVQRIVATNAVAPGINFVARCVSLFLSPTPGFSPLRLYLGFQDI